MGSEQQFCLRWNNHQINMLGVFDQLLQSEALVDVTLACEGLSLKAHKVVLCACSPYFQSLFLENPCKHPIVILKDVKYGDLKALIDFMYRGEVNVSQDQLSALLKTAETLKVKGLAEVTGGINDQVPVSEPGVSNQSTASSPPQPQHAGPPTETSGRSPPAKRKKIRQRRRSGGSADQSDREEDNSRDMQNPLEVLETKVEISDDDYELSRRRLESSEKNIGPSQSAELSLEGPCELNPDPVIPVGVNAAFSVANMELGSSGGSSTTGGSHLPPTSGPTLMSSSSGQHLPPIPPQSLPMLSTQSLPSTSGSQPSQETEADKSKSNRYQCDLCDKSYSAHPSLSRHRRMHRQVQFLCDECNKPFTRRDSLLVHKKRCHKMQITQIDEDGAEVVASIILVTDGKACK